MKKKSVQLTIIDMFGALQSEDCKVVTSNLINTAEYFIYVMYVNLLIFFGFKNGHAAMAKS